MRLRPLLVGSVDWVAGGSVNIPGPANLNRVRLVFNGTAQAAVTVDFDAYGPITLDHNGNAAHGQIVSAATARGLWVIQHADEGINDRTSVAGGAAQAVLDIRMFAQGDNRNGFPLGAGEYMTLTLPGLGAAVLVSGTIEVYTVLGHCRCQYVPRYMTGSIPTLPGAGNTLVPPNLPDNLYTLILHPATGGGATNPGLLQIVDGSGTIQARGSFDALRRSGIMQYDIEATMTDCMVPFNTHDGAIAENLLKGTALQVTGGVGAMAYTMLALEPNEKLTDRSIVVASAESEMIQRSVEQSSLPPVVKQSLTPGFSSRLARKKAEVDAAARNVRRAGGVRRLPGIL